MKPITADEWDEVRKEGKRVYVVINHPLAEGNHRIIAIDPADPAYPHKAWFDMTYYPCYRNYYFHAWAHMQKLIKWREMKMKKSTCP